MSSLDSVTIIFYDGFIEMEPGKSITAVYHRAYRNKLWVSELISTVLWHEFNLEFRGEETSNHARCSNSTVAFPIFMDNEPNQPGS